MDESFKKRIVLKNLNLPPHEIKKKLKQQWPETTNEDVEKLIIGMDKIEFEINQNER